MFELKTALSYLVPRKGRVSQSITTLIAVLVISTIVWLSLVYFSTIEDIETRWARKIQGVTGTLEIIPEQAYLQDFSSQIDQKLPQYGYAVPRLSLHAHDQYPKWDEEQDGPLPSSLEPALHRPLPLYRLIELLSRQPAPFSWHLFEQQAVHTQIFTQDGVISQYNLVRGVDSVTSLIPLVSPFSQLDDSEVRQLLQVLADSSKLETRLLRTPLHLLVDLPSGTKATLTISQGKDSTLLIQEPKTQTRYSLHQLLSTGSNFHLLDKSPCLVTDSDEFVPFQQKGYPLLLPIQMRKQGLRLLSHLVLSATEETKGSEMATIKGFVAGFFDPGVLPVGSKLIIASNDVVTQLSLPLFIQEPISSSGISIDQPRTVKKADLDELLKENELQAYFSVRSFEEAPMTKELFDQLNNEHTLFQLLSSIFLLVASANILSMLFIVARDRKKELALFRALGLRRRRLCSLFSLAGFLTGLVALFIGYLLASLTLYFLPECLSVISWAQGRNVLDPTIFGEIGPTHVRLGSFFFCGFFVLISATIAGMGASLYATRISISEALKEP